MKKERTPFLFHGDVADPLIDRGWREAEESLGHRVVPPRAYATACCRTDDVRADRSGSSRAAPPSVGGPSRHRASPRRGRAAHGSGVTGRFESPEGTLGRHDEDDDEGVLAGLEADAEPELECAGRSWRTRSRVEQRSGLSARGPAHPLGTGAAPRDDSTLRQCRVTACRHCRWSPLPSRGRG